MTLNKQKPIEAMAQAIRCAQVDDTLNAPHEYIIGSKILAQAAFAALQDYMPESKLESSPRDKATENLVNHAIESVWWTQLKNLGR